MPSPKAITVFSLVTLGALFAIGNVWFTAVRSTIPLSVDSVVSRKQRLTEKTVGVDDVYFVTLASNCSIQVDADVYDAVSVGDSMRKQAGARSVLVAGREVELQLSSDFRGMIWVMPGVVILFCILGLRILGSNTQGVNSNPN